MACGSSYRDCVRQHRSRGVGAELSAYQYVAEDGCRLPPGLGGSGQVALTGL